MAEQRYLYLTAKNACHYVNSISECEKHQIYAYPSPQGQT